MKTTSEKLDRAKLFGFAQVEKLKSPEATDRLIDHSSKIGGENGGQDRDKVLWSKIGNTEN